MWNNFFYLSLHSLVSTKKIVEMFVNYLNIEI